MDSSIHESEWGKRSNMKKKIDDFDLVNLPDACRDPEITNEDFTLRKNTVSHEQSFQTKPTTFFKDSLKRFKKNKSSVVATYILGALILLAIIVPFVSPYDVKKGMGDTAYYNLEPKLFNNANGFWDGTVKVYNKPVDTSKGDNPETDWWPDPDAYAKGGVKNKQFTDIMYTSVASKFGTDGYFHFGYYGGNDFEEAYLTTREMSTNYKDFKFTLNLDSYDLTLTKFESVDEEKISKFEAERLSTISDILPENFTLGKLSLSFFYYDGEDNLQEVELVAPKLLQNIGTTLTGYDDTDPVDISSIIKTQTGQSTFTKFYFGMKVVAPSEETPKSESICTLIKNFVIEPSASAPDKVKNYFNYSGEYQGICFTNCMEAVDRSNDVKTKEHGSIKNPGYWKTANSNDYVKKVHLGKCRFVSFVYDGYEGNLGEIEWVLEGKELYAYRESGMIDYEILINLDEDDNPYVEVFMAPEPGVNWANSPVTYKDAANGIIFELSDIVPIKGGAGGFDPETSFKVNCHVIYYKYKGRTTMPSFLFGTDSGGRDMFKYVFEGLRNSLGLGVITFVICFLFGLIWGAISGYFGGTVDLLMERFTDILSGMPWIVMMTLIILKTNSRSFGVFLFAVCITGWIGTASTTRTQFYRFRGREYVLASRTLGASDARLIAKHILPNAMGTIITKAVLMIPSVIFSEATLAYLGLGFDDISSLGVILSENQKALTSYPYQLIFPSVIIALVMISFNLFGNGLRDAINPSLKGDEQ